MFTFPTKEDRSTRERDGESGSKSGKRVYPGAEFTSDQLVESKVVTVDLL